MEILDLVLRYLSSAFLFVGCLLIFSGGIGVLRFPDFYTRMHAAGVTDTLAAALILIGLAFIAGWSLVSAKLMMILLFLLFTGPTASHALAKAAYMSGLKPVGCDKPLDATTPGERS